MQLRTASVTWGGKVQECKDLTLDTKLGFGDQLPSAAALSLNPSFTFQLQKQNHPALKKSSFWAIIHKTVSEYLKFTFSFHFLSLFNILILTVFPLLQEKLGDTVGAYKMPWRSPDPSHGRARNNLSRLSLELRSLTLTAQHNSSAVLQHQEEQHRPKSWKPPVLLHLSSK